MRAARALIDATRFRVALLIAVLACLAWAATALLLGLILPRERGARWGRAGASYGFRFIGWLVGVLGVYSLDLRELDALRRQPPMLLAPNHPTLMDAPFIISRLPRLTCVMKAGLQRSVLLGASSRLAHYVANTASRAMIRDCVRELQAGSPVLLFPEGTRTPPDRLLGELKAAAALIATRAGVAVQTLIIESDPPYMAKGWSPLRRPPLPVRFSVRLGKRFEASSDASHLLAQIDDYFHDALAAPRERRGATV